MASESQIQANKANALKSTGPRTAQGKATARRNALKHGMTCEKENLFGSDAKLYKDRLASWTKTAKPRNDMELYQLESAVQATVNLDRCARNAQAKLDERTRKVVGHFDSVQTKKLNRAVQGWTTQPAACVAQLETFTRGCEWLLEQWDGLSKALETNECWTGVEAGLAMRLLGKCPEMFHDGDAEVAAFRTLVVAALPDIKPDEADKILRIDTSQLEPEARKAEFAAKLPSREDAREGLWAVFDAELERLAAIREQLWESQDEPALSAKINLVSFDDSKNGVLRRRYESANHLDMHRCLKEFSEQRRQTDVHLDEDLEEQAEIEAERKIAERVAQERLERDRLRNGPKSPAPTQRRIITCGKTPAGRPSDFSDPARYIKKAAELQEAASEGSRAPNPVAPGADEVQNPS